MNTVPTALELISKNNPNYKYDEYGFEEIENFMLGFAQIHVAKIKNLQQAKYSAGETGYITEKEWAEIFNNIK